MTAPVRVAPSSDDRKLPRLRLLWSFARPHRRALGLGLFLALLGSAGSLATPMVTKWVLDSLSTFDSLRGPVLALLGLLVLGVVIWLWQWILLGTVGERVILDARESMVRRLFRATVPAVTSRPTGEFITRVTSDTVLLREAASSSVIGLINGSVMLVGTLALMAVLDLVLLGATVAAVVVMAVLFSLLMPGIAKAQERAQAHVGTLGAVLEGTLRAIRTVKVSRAEQRQSDRIVGEARESARQSVRAVRREAYAWTLAWSGIQLAIIMILGIGAWRVSTGDLAVSSLIAFLLYAFGLMEPVTTLSRHLTALQSGIAAAGRIRQIEAMPVESDPTAATATDPATVSTDPATAAGDPPVLDPPVLELRRITAGYGPDLPAAVREVDLAVPRRGHVAIVGPSGAGKTTLFSLILRFLAPQHGEVLLDGRPYADLSHAQVRQRLAYVEQDTPVIPGTIRENLLFTYPDATEAEIRRALHAVRLTEKVDSLGAGLDIPLTPSSMSGGQRQRIALARAILRRPDVLLLDEATAQVDGLTEVAIHDCIREQAAHGAVVTIAHRLSTVIDADTIVVMEAGQVRARGDHQSLLATDQLYRELVEALRIAQAGEPAEQPAEPVAAGVAGHDEPAAEPLTASGAR
ncbi:MULTISPECIES: ABC transporter ATP-binding protein [unclassified Solwaraspora]|uniref:ABC transporter ATP-binding protein n=1 Tax=unclassified Solwaraspora TaxID=2627926 RepID=UPI00259B1869|nr:ABC transporter ATP-binding protein [Solwaraspora sp. WMMA2056]WJK42737.1 ABC transporter ATP-binding protein [Solwaraspora sp. WMMA2056]